ncbi:glycosyltransferase family 4 protein [Candidatus Parcubacteria bacterium]|nr:MAG: glycosyltransferase family 4 protein [Candidatus Parcubacteria bacterium]
MKVALVHDHLAQQGGAEKVLEVLAEMYPDAPIYVLLYKKEVVEKYFKNRTILASIIQKLPWGVKRYRWYLALMPMAVEFFDLSDYDLVISDTSSFAKGVITKPETVHICYCHTPTRYLWSDTHQYIAELKYNKYFKKIISLVLNYIRIWDKLAADRVDYFIANSETVQKRIKKYYKRDSEIIYPSIEEEKFYISNKQGDYFLAGCRLVPYKRIDIIIEAFRGSDKKLKIFGDGLGQDDLKAMAKDCDNIEFLGRVSDDERNKLFSECQAYINPQKEDFGITIVEAMASGRPVIALGQGGATETVIPGETGELFENETVEDLKKVIQDFDTSKYNPEKIREHALKFSKDNFKKQIREFVERKTNLSED